MENSCKEIPKEKPVETVGKSGTGYVCKICNNSLRHQNNVKRHKKICKEIKKMLEYPCSFCDRLFA